MLEGTGWLGGGIGGAIGVGLPPARCEGPAGRGPKRCDRQKRTGCAPVQVAVAGTSVPLRRAGTGKKPTRWAGGPCGQNCVLDFLNIDGTPGSCPFRSSRRAESMPFLGKVD